MKAPTRPSLRWHGGKWRLAPWIIEHFPAHRVYVEPFGGAASVLLRKPRSYAEVYNDLDDGVVNLFTVLRDVERAPRLLELLKSTPFARKEFFASYEVSQDPIEEARRLIIRSFMGFGSDGHNRAVRTGFRAASNRSGTTPAHDWVNYPANLKAVIERLAGVVIENRDAIEIIRQHDGHDTLFYLDPPYLPEVRSAKSRRGGGKYHTYAHEMTSQDHELLLMEIRRIKGMVVLSGYSSNLYDYILMDWERIEKQTHADGARARTEVLWLNAASTDRLVQRELGFSRRKKKHGDEDGTT